MRGLVLIVLGACGTDPATLTDASQCTPYVVPATTDLSAPTVSFKTDVMKVFNSSCGLVACHGSTTGAQGGLFLGAESAMRTDAAQVYAGITGKPSAELSTMMFVVPGDPEHSYLMHKMDGDQCQFQTACADGNCRALMPSGGTQLLPVGTRDIVRRWIAQGAPAN